jgi:hypothetical protein
MALPRWDRQGETPGLDPARRNSSPKLNVFDRERTLRRARQFEMASHLAEWLNSPGLKPPR